MPWRALLIVWLASGCDGVFGLDLPAGEDGGARDADILDAAADADLDAGADAPDGAMPDAPVGAIMEVVAGGSHTCAVASAVVKCWGLGDSGQLGYAALGDVGDNEAPRTRPGVDVGPGITGLALGGAHTCARASTGAVRCWGLGSSGQLGYGSISSIGDNEAPATAGDVPVGAAAVQVVAGNAHTCALLMDGSVRCWGANASGQLGYGNINQVGDNELPSSAGSVALGEAALALAAGDAHTCAVLASGNIRCWGSGLDGRLGYGNLASVGDGETPSQQASFGFTSPAVAIAAGAAHSCALLGDGSVRCWGSSAFGQLGYGNTTTIGDNESASGAVAVSLGGSAVAITAGGDHTCALLIGGEVRCWGRAASGELGLGNTVTIGDTELPSAVGVVPVGGPVTQISAGRTHTCAVLSTGAVRCWGNGLNGRLGLGATATIGDDEPASAGGDVPAY